MQTSLPSHHSFKMWLGTVKCAKFMYNDNSGLMQFRSCDWLARLNRGSHTLQCCKKTGRSKLLLLAKEGHSSSELYNIQHVLFLSCIWEISEKHQHLFVGLRLFKVMNPTDFGE